MKIMNMIKRCLISLFLINFSFLLSAVDFKIEVLEYEVSVDLNVEDKSAIIVYKGLKAKIKLDNSLKADKDEHVYLLSVENTMKSETNVIIIKENKEKKEEKISKKIAGGETKEFKEKVACELSYTDDNKNIITIFHKSGLRTIYKKLDDEEKNKKPELIESKENETSNETKESELNEPNKETIILDGIKAVDNGEFVEVGSVNNNSDYDVILYILNKDYNNPKSKYSINLKKGDSEKIYRKIRQITVKKKETDVDEIKIWSPDDSMKEWEKNHKNDGVGIMTNTQEEKTKAKIKISKDELIKLIKEDLEKDTCWSESSIAKIKEKFESAEKELKNAKDKDIYAKDNGVYDFIGEELRKLDENRIDKKAEELISNYRKRYDIGDEKDCKKEIKQILEKRNRERRDALEELAKLFNVEVKNLAESPIVSIVVIVLIVIIIIVCLTILSKKKKVEREEPISQVSSTNDVAPAIVVRKTATSILKKQCLDDVINNNSYFKIESVDFCDDSAVRCIYIKNTCIKEIYNMYAEDLRNPNNPKEDGCMVLGRWIYDEQANEYNVSLEEIVRPGDDAIFQEYELNFGGKIKLRVAEKLRKLRKESNLQYDLTCWVHSHPGLGVFFSNSDSSVQMQLKHSTHPNFLTAIVVDILTPEQDLGIFTFKRDSSINSLNDLKKMYSLEELYKWAVESDRNSYKPEDHYNVLSKAKKVCEDCSKVMLSNGAIIDVSAIVMKQNSGLEGLIYGYKAQNTLKNEYVVCSVENNDQSHENELLGCLIIGTHCSIPSIKKAIVDYMNKIKFIMFYSLKDETITTIPITNNELCMEEKYYSEEKLNDLKIWTRRKR